MILRCFSLILITLASISYGELIEMECGFIDTSDRGLQCEFNNIYTFDSTDVNIIERNSTIDAVLFRQSELYSVPSDLFVKFPFLKHVDVELTQLKVIKPDNFRNANELKYLLARFNEIKSLQSETFASCPKLKFIVLQYNQINHIDARAFNGLINLEALYLDYNRMITLPAQLLDALPNLLHFSMAYNNLTDIPEDLFMKNDKLETLNLAHNLLRVFNDKQFDVLPNLEHVQLNSNNLTELDLVACKSSEINVDKNHLELIELNKWTRIVSAWNNPVKKLVLHEHYGTGRSYNFSFNHINEIVFFVHQHCCTVENLENFSILIQSFGDLSKKNLDVADWNCKFLKNVGYETNTGYITNNVCTKVRNVQIYVATTASPENTILASRNNLREDNLESNEDNTEWGSVNMRNRDQLSSTGASIFTGMEFESSSTDLPDEYTAFIEEVSTTESYEKKAEKGIFKTIKKKVSGWKNSVVRKWNDWVG